MFDMFAAFTLFAGTFGPAADAYLPISIPDRTAHIEGTDLSRHYGTSGFNLAGDAFESAADEYSSIPIPDRTPQIEVTDFSGQYANSGLNLAGDAFESAAGEYSSIPIPEVDPAVNGQVTTDSEIVDHLVICPIDTNIAADVVIQGVNTSGALLDVEADYYRYEVYAQDGIGLLSGEQLSLANGDFAIDLKSRALSQLESGQAHLRYTSSLKAMNVSVVYGKSNDATGVLEPFMSVPCTAIISKPQPTIRPPAKKYSFKVECSIVTDLKYSNLFVEFVNNGKTNADITGGASFVLPAGAQRDVDGGGANLAYTVTAESIEVHMSYMISIEGKMDLIRVPCTVTKLGEAVEAPKPIFGSPYK